MGEPIPKVSIWKASRQTRIGVQDFVAMHGGPKAMRLAEHEHAEIQIQAHFSPIALSRNPATILPDSYRLIPSRKPHVGSWAEGNEVIVLLLHPHQLEIASDELLHRAKYDLVAGFWGADPVIHSVAGVLRREFLTGASDPLFLEALRTVLAGHLVRTFSSSGARPIRGRLSPRLFNKVMEIIQERLGTDLSVEELAAHCHMGVHQFTRLFRVSTGCSPYRYVTSQRIARAKELLTATNLPLVDIAYKIGFSSQSHFCTSFRRHTQFTPQRYRCSAR